MAPPGKRGVPGILRRPGLALATLVAVVCALGARCLVFLEPAVTAKSKKAETEEPAVRPGRLEKFPRRRLSQKAPARTSSSAAGAAEMALEPPVAWEKRRVSASAAACATMATVSAAAPAAAARVQNNTWAEWLPRVLLFLMALCCSTNFTLIKVLEDGHAPEVVSAARFAVAAIPFLPMIPSYLDRRSVQSGVEIGLWCVLGYVAQAIGLQYTEASKGAFICSLAMVVVPVVKAWMGEKVRNELWAAVALAVTGTALLVGLGASDGPNIGDLICGGTAVGFGLMFVRMDHHAKDEDFDAIGCTVWQVVTLAVCFLAWVIASDGLAASSEVLALLTSSSETSGILAWIGFVTTAGVLLIETWAMERVDGAEAGVIFASEPVWATIFAAIVLGETFGVKEACGGALILSACLLTQLKSGDGSDRKEIDESLVA